MEQKKTALVTGATDGIGKEIATHLGKAGFRVLVHGRTREKAEGVARELGLEAVYGDFGSLEEVSKLAEMVAATAPKLDVLINNAGIKSLKRALSSDGIETTWAVNHLAPVLLTKKLLPLLRASIARVITQSSVAHHRGAIDFKDLQGEGHWDSYKSYAQSKLANLMFSLSLAKKEDLIASHGVHPGAVNTKLLREGFGVQGNPVISGARPALFAASDASCGTTSGRFFGPNGEERPSDDALNEAVQEELWQVTLAQLQPWI